MFFKKILVYFGLIFLSPLCLAGDVHEYHLKNGLTLLVKEDHRAPVVISESGTKSAVVMNLME